MERERLVPPRDRAPPYDSPVLRSAEILFTSGKILTREGISGYGA